MPAASGEASVRVSRIAERQDSRASQREYYCLKEAIKTEIRGLDQIIGILHGQGIGLTVPPLNGQ
jgi:hypothetical protein